MYQKADVPSRAAAALFAVESGLIRRRPPDATSLGWRHHRPSDRKE
jgi:hypothetical protein